MLAARDGNCAIVKLLIGNGAQVKARNIVSLDALRRDATALSCNGWLLDIYANVTYQFTEYDPMDIIFIVTFNSYVSVIMEGNGTLIQVFYSIIYRSMARHLSCSPYRAECLKSSSICSAKERILM